jgi:hypothetical protein
MKQPNPYLNGTSPFVNRTQDFERLLSSLLSSTESTQCWSIVGQRHIGKTTLVQHLALPEAALSYEFTHAKHRFVYFDCHKQQRALRSSDAFFRAMCQSLVEALPVELHEKVGRGPNYTPTSGSWLDEWDRLFEDLIARGEFLIWIFDGFESAIRQERLLNEGAFGVIRGYAQVPQFAWLTCTNRSLIHLFNDAFREHKIPKARQDEASDFFNVAVEHPVTLFTSHTDVETLIREPSTAHGVFFSPDEIATIVGFGGRFPYYLQVACHHFFDAHQRNDVQVQPLLRRCLSEVAPLWERYWSKLDEPQRERLLAIARGEPSSIRERMVGDLEYQALIYERNGSYQPFSEEFRNFLLTRHSGEVQRNWPLPKPALSSVVEPLQTTLRFLPTPAGATISWESKAIRTASSSTFVLPYSSDHLPIVVKALDAIQYPDYPQDGPSFDAREQVILARHRLWANNRVVPDAHQLIGRQLYDALTSDPDGAQVLKTVRDAARLQGRALSYTLRFPDNALEIAALPWEMLWDQHQAVLLSLGHQEIDWCQRSIDVSAAFSPSLNRDVTKPLHILAISPRTGIPSYIREEERSARRKTWDILQSAGRMTWDELEPVTALNLYERMRRAPRPDVIHFYGHGIYRDGKGYLFFDHPIYQDKSEAIEVQRLAVQFSGVHLIVLHACQSAMAGAAGLLTGIAPALSLVAEAVVAMQLTVRISAATRFLEVLYEEIGAGQSLQAAVAEARRALFITEGIQTSWYVPTLYIREEHPVHFIQPLP